MNSDVFILEPTPAPFLFALSGGASEVRSFLPSVPGEVRNARGRIRIGMALATPVLGRLPSALGSVGSEERAEGRNVTGE